MIKNYKKKCLLFCFVFGAVSSLTFAGPLGDFVTQGMSEYDHNYRSHYDSIKASIELGGQDIQLSDVEKVLGTQYNVYQQQFLFNQNFVRDLLKRGGPLAVAVDSGDLERLRAVLQKKSNNLSGSTFDATDALNRASSKGLTEMIALLVNAGADVNAPGYPLSIGNRFRPLEMAANAGQKEAVKTLLRLGADPVLSKSGLVESTPHHALRLAVASNQVGVAQILLEMGSDPNAPQAQNAAPVPAERTLFTMAVEKDFSEMMELLVQEGAKIDPASLLITIKRGDVRQFELLVNHGTILDQKIFHAIASEGKAELLKNMIQRTLTQLRRTNERLIAKGEAPEKTEEQLLREILTLPTDGLTLLQASAKNGNVEIAALLLELGNHNEVDPSSQKLTEALKTAMDAKNIPLMKLFVANDALDLKEKLAEIDAALLGLTTAFSAQQSAVARQGRPNCWSTELKFVKDRGILQAVQSVLQTEINSRKERRPRLVRKALDRQGMIPDLANMVVKFLED